MLKLQILIKNNSLSADYNASALKDLYVPKAWEEQGFRRDLDNGLALIRKPLFLNEDLTKMRSLYLGKIDDEDLTYFNGKKWDKMKQWSMIEFTTFLKIFKKGKMLLL